MNLEPAESCGLRWEFGRTWENGSSREGGFREERLCSIQCLYSSPVIRSHTRDSGQHQAYKHHRSEVSGPNKRPEPICVGECERRKLVRFTPQMLLCLK